MAIRNSNPWEDFSHRLGESACSIPMRSDMPAPIAGLDRTDANPVNNTKREALLAACVAHVLHDGYTDLIYVMLPIWQAQFRIGYGCLAIIRALYVGAMAGLQLPANNLAERFGGKVILIIGTVIAATGYGLAGLSAGLLGLCAALILAGSGSSAQHPIGSGIVSRAYGQSARGPLGIYNFAGDLGKAVLPGGTSLLLIVLPWHVALWAIAILGLAVAVFIALLLPAATRRPSRILAEDNDATSGGQGFALLFVIGVLDTGVRMGLLIFLPFILKAKGASIPIIGVALAIVFIGGAAGKFICGWLGAKLGVLWSVVLTEGATAFAILMVLVLPLLPTLIMLLLLGALLNGTSSVLYGTVPEVASADQTERAFAIFYTGTIGSGAIFPILYGFLGDLVGINWATVSTAVTAFMILPFAFRLAPKLPK
jgi:MFS transporter, FSR family, fosmidomycin resistance protein